MTDADQWTPVHIMKRISLLGDFRGEKIFARVTESDSRNIDEHDKKSQLNLPFCHITVASQNKLSLWNLRVNKTQRYIT